MSVANQPAGEGGEEWFDPGDLDRLRALFLRLRKRGQRQRVRRRPPAAVRTREFKDYRPYSCNDDFRAVDWRVYARLGRLFVRLFEEAREDQVHLLIDASASMERPFAEKRRTALRLAVALAYLGLSGNHRVAIHTMRGRLTGLLPLLRGQGSMHRVIESLRKLEFGGVTKLAACFEEFRPGRRGHPVTFVISDLLSNEPGAVEEALRRAGIWRGETHVIQILHPGERRPEWEGDVRLADAETGEELTLRLTRREQRRYGEWFDGFLSGIQRSCAQRRLDYLLWMTDRKFEEVFPVLMERGSVLGRRG